MERQMAEALKRLKARCGKPRVAGAAQHHPELPAWDMRPNAFGRRIHSAAGCIQAECNQGRMHSAAECNQGRMQSIGNMQ